MQRDLRRAFLPLLLGGLLLAACGDASEARLAPATEEDPGTIESTYGGGKSGNRTGWLCGTWRGNWW
ncbi:hypothetical protein [Archangium sp.]|uniref:hypothetical protein n=1 Tax=Archangium sp. TaxID=1872627 RepID=UPI002D48FD3A|nr:hypothetical protein [Archangium sp.]HYO59838.1 hypothetical protein [Archangium sp.]